MKYINESDFKDFLKTNLNNEFKKELDLCFDEYLKDADQSLLSGDDCFVLPENMTASKAIEYYNYKEFNNECVYANKNIKRSEKQV
jgi:hypothetical protein